VEAEIKKLKQWSVVLLFLVSVLCARISWLRAEEVRIDNCVEYFTELLEIYRLRQMLHYGIQEIERRHETGNITKEELDTTVEIWNTTDSELQSKAVKIHQVATKEKCFEKEK